MLKALTYLLIALALVGALTAPSGAVVTQPSTPIIDVGCSSRVDARAAGAAQTATNVAATVLAYRFGLASNIVATVGSNATAQIANQQHLVLTYEVATQTPIAWAQFRLRFGDGSTRLIRITTLAAPFALGTQTTTGGGYAACTLDVVRFADGTTWAPAT